MREELTLETTLSDKAQKSEEATVWRGGTPKYSNMNRADFIICIALFTIAILLQEVDAMELPSVLKRKAVSEK